MKQGYQERSGIAPELSREIKLTNEIRGVSEAYHPVAEYGFLSPALKQSKPRPEAAETEPKKKFTFSN